MWIKKFKNIYFEYSEVKLHLLFKIPYVEENLRKSCFKLELRLLKSIFCTRT